MRRLWLIFAQTVTVCLGVLFLVTTLRPQWLPGHDTAGGGTPAVATKGPETSAPVLGVVTYAPAVSRAAPSVVNVYTAKHVEVPLVPLPADPGLEQLLRTQLGGSRGKGHLNRMLHRGWTGYQQVGGRWDRLLKISVSAELSDGRIFGYEPG